MNDGTAFNHQDRLLMLDALTPRERDILQLMVADLSNAEIAERLVMTVGTVRWYVSEIYSKLDVHSRDEAIARAAELNHAPESQAVPPTPTNLPALTTSLVGREREIAAVRQRLLREDVRLLTLVGTPGIGKTRLSLETAAALMSDFPDGVYFVPLAPLSDPALVPNAIAQPLGVQEMGGQSIAELLKYYLREKSLLLVLDNFEHQLAAAPLVTELLAAAPHLKVLATSREALRLYGEQEYPVPPLALPDSRYGDGIEILGNCEAVALFVRRAQAVKPEFNLTAENAKIIADICIRLDGLPLAIELAAARIKLYTPQALFERLHKRLSALTGGARDLPERQQTLRSAIAWSYDLLSEDEQRLFARLGVFVGGWTLEAMQAVCVGASHDSPLQIDIQDGLESLLNKSLVQQTESATGEPRFTMLETLREYALEKLGEYGEEEATRRAHAHHFLALAGSLGAAVRTAEEFQAFQTFEMEHTNIRSAWLFAVQRCDESLLGLAAEDMRRFYADWGWLHDGLVLYSAALDALDDRASLTVVDLINGYASLEFQSTNSYEVSEELAVRALEMCKQLGNHDRKVTPLSCIATAHSWRGEYEEAERLYLEAIEIAKATKPRMLDGMMMNLALIYSDRKDFDRSRQMLETLRESLKQRGIRAQLSWVLSNLFAVAIDTDDFTAARRLARELLENASEIKQSRFLSIAHSQLSLLAFIARDYARASEHA